MSKEISIGEFVQFVDCMETKHPDTNVIGIGIAYKDGKSYFAIWLDDHGKEISYKIPMLAKS